MAASAARGQTLNRPQREDSPHSVNINWNVFVECCFAHCNENSLFLGFKHPSAVFAIWTLQHVLRHKIQGGKLTINTVVEELVEEGVGVFLLQFQSSLKCAGVITQHSAGKGKERFKLQGIFHWLRCWEDPWKRKRDLNTWLVPLRLPDS